MHEAQPQDPWVEFDAHGFEHANRVEVTRTGHHFVLGELLGNMVRIALGHQGKRRHPVLEARRSDHSDAFICANELE